jgi:hypothetical protein
VRASVALRAATADPIASRRNRAHEVILPRRFALPCQTLIGLQQLQCHKVTALTRSSRPSGTLEVAEYSATNGQSAQGVAGSASLSVPRSRWDTFRPESVTTDPQSFILATPVPPAGASACTPRSGAPHAPTASSQPACGCPWRICLWSFAREGCKSLPCDQLIANRSHIVKVE